MVIETSLRLYIFGVTYVVMWLALNVKR